MEAQVAPESTIIRRVGQCRHEWIRDGGSEPKHLYVGQLEYAALMEVMQTVKMMLYESHPEDNHIYFMGLRVHRVLEPEHLRVC